TAITVRGGRRSRAAPTATTTSACTAAAYVPAARLRESRVDEPPGVGGGIFEPPGVGGGTMKVVAEHVAKPWGHETIWARTDRYVGKILHVRAGESLSLQYHERKDETMRVLSGALELEVGGEDDARTTVRLGPGDGWHIPPGTRHRMRALVDTD